LPKVERSSIKLTRADRRKTKMAKSKSEVSEKNTIEMLRANMTECASLSVQARSVFKEVCKVLFEGTLDPPPPKRDESLILDVKEDLSIFSELNANVKKARFHLSALLNELNYYLRAINHRKEVNPNKKLGGG